MQTLTIKCKALGVVAGGSSAYNTQTHQTVTTPGKITRAAINDFYSKLGIYKRDAINTIWPILQRGGFVYGADLWKWTVTTTNKEIGLWATITFEDTRGEGKTAFMRRIQNTGILQYSKIIKSYS